MHLVIKFNMRTEDLFKYGVTPTEGKNAGKRYRVLQIYPGRIIVADWNDESAQNESWLPGTYDIYHEPKTLFEDSSVKPTWGNLKKAMESAGLGDDTLFIVPRSDWFFLGYGEPASFSIEILHQPAEKPRKHVVVK